MLQRTSNTVDLGDSTRFRTRLTQAATGAAGVDSFASREALRRLLEAISGDSRLFLCGPHLPDKMNISFTGSAWELNAETTRENAT